MANRRPDQGGPLADSGKPEGSTAARLKFA